MSEDMGNLILSLLLLITENFVTSEPVPAVVGIHTMGRAFLATLFPVM